MSLPPLTGLRKFDQPTSPPPDPAEPYLWFDGEWHLIAVDRADVTKEFNPDQPRDDRGRWTSGGGGDAGGGGADATGRMLGALDSSGLVGNDAFDAYSTGRLADTQAVHSSVNPQTGERTYSAERSALHEQIVDGARAGRPSQEAPQALFTAGGPASGKSGLYGGSAAAPPVGAGLAERQKMAGPADAVVVDPDAVKAQLPEYHGMIAAGRADAASAANHEESSDVAKQIQSAAVEQRQNVVVDGIGDSGGSKFADKIMAAQAAGYDVTVRYAVLSVDNAIERATLRGQSSGRQLTPEMVTAAHESVARAFVRSIQNGVPGAKVEVYDNTAGLTPIATRDGAGSWTVHDPEKYNSFVARGQGG